MVDNVPIVGIWIRGIWGLLDYKWSLT